MTRPPADIHTPLQIDAALLEEAIQAGHHGSSREAVEQALRAYIRLQRGLRLVALAGEIDLLPPGQTAEKE